jgi:ribose/xylose/arabinose/galactoside ABC-type transport system permease subunit
MNATGVARSRRLDTRAFLQRFGLLVSFGVLCSALSLLSGRFLQASNLINILRQASISGIIAVGMTYVILTAGIDLSVGSVLALTAVITADLMHKGVAVSPAVLVGLGLGALLGAINGWIITRGRIPAFITTLGMSTVARGLALSYTQGKPITELPKSFDFFGAGTLGPVPMPIIIAALVFIPAYVLLMRTRVGQHVYALGSNPVAARLAGINVNRHIVFVYSLSGLLSALAGLLLIARLDSAQPILGQGYDFDAIAAVVVGGTMFTGGEGGLAQTLLGALFIVVLGNGLNLLNVSPLWEQVVKGCVIALALLLYKAAER